MKEILNEANIAIDKFLRDDEEGKTDAYSSTQIVSIRDSLLAASAVRLARRSKELMTMTVEEVNMAESIPVNNDEMFVVKVNTVIMCDLSNLNYSSQI